MSESDKRAKLAEVAREVAVCRQCQLYRQATRAVPGEGKADAEVMFIGEGPGYNEDQQGRPFVGAAGKLLEANLAAVGWRREDVFIGNTVKHRPPENRDPLPEELIKCAGFLDRQIEIIDPGLIVTLGRFSMGKFLPGVMISRVHGKARKVGFKGRDYWVLPMYHPAAALRDGQVMREFREDFLQIPELVEKIRKEEEDENEEGEGEQLSLV